MNHYILGVDPGKTSGVCLVATAEPKVVYSAELTEEELFAKIPELIKQYGAGIVDVVTERFIINSRTHKNSQAPFSLEIIGSLKHIMYELYGSSSALKFSSTDAKKFSTNEKLKACGLWHVGGKGHANDSLRHVLRYMVAQGWADKRLLG